MSKPLFNNNKQYADLKVYDEFVKDLRTKPVLEVYEDWKDKRGYDCIHILQAISYFISYETSLLVLRKQMKPE